MYFSIDSNLLSLFKPYCLFLSSGHLPWTIAKVPSLLLFHFSVPSSLTSHDHLTKLWKSFPLSRIRKEEVNSRFLCIIFKTSLDLASASFTNKFFPNLPTKLLGVSRKHYAISCLIFYFHWVKCNLKMNLSQDTKWTLLRHSWSLRNLFHECHTHDPKRRLCILMCCHPCTLYISDNSHHTKLYSFVK